MLDPNLLRNDIDVVAKALKIKGYDLDVEAYQSLESDRKALQVESEELQAKRNARSKEIGKTKAQGGDVDALMAEVASFADQLKASQEKLEEVKELLYGLQMSCSQELQNSEHKMKKVEKRLRKRAKRVNSESDSVEDIWNVKEERVSEVIGEWVAQYEDKVNDAMDDLQREELIFKTQIEEEDEKYKQ